MDGYDIPVIITDVGFYDLWLSLVFATTTGTWAMVWCSRAMQMPERPQKRSFEKTQGH